MHVIIYTFYHISNVDDYEKVMTLFGWTIEDNILMNIMNTIVKWTHGYICMNQHNIWIDSWLHLNEPGQYFNYCNMFLPKFTIILDDYTQFGSGIGWNISDFIGSEIK